MARTGDDARRVVATYPDDTHAQPRRRSRSAAGLDASIAGHRGWVFFFFSNRLGCLGSLLVSVVVTVVLILLLFR